MVANSSGTCCVGSEVTSFHWLSSALAWFSGPLPLYIVSVNVSDKVAVSREP